jgi:hypothetical protein
MDQLAAVLADNFGIAAGRGKGLVLVDRETVAAGAARDSQSLVHGIDSINQIVLSAFSALEFHDISFPLSNRETKKGLRIALLISVHPA